MKGNSYIAWCKLNNKPCIYKEPDDANCNVFCPNYSFIKAVEYKKNSKKNAKK